MRSLIIPDVHNKTAKLKRLLEPIGHEYDQIIQLGDWVDDFGDNSEIIASVAEDINYLDKHYPMVYLWGNHDLPYRYPSKYTMCPGFTLDKQKALIATLDREIWDKFHFYTNVDGYVLSHAGFRDDILVYVNDSDIKEAYQALEDGEYHPLISIGRARGGYWNFGGPLWLDWDQEFISNTGLNQIVGHTPHTQPRWKGSNLCLDTHLHHYATLIDGKLEVHTWPTSTR